MAYWYVASNDPDDILLLDIDDWYKRVPRYHIYGEMFRQRLRDAMNSQLLNVRELWIEESNSHNHFHVFIRLRNKMELDKRMVWQSRLGSDWKRSHADSMRAANHINPASLLIRTNRVDGMWRQPDFECPCPNGKHVTLEQVELLRQGKGCPIWEKNRGATPWDLFGRPEHLGMIEKRIDLRTGKVPLEDILQIGELRAYGEGETENSGTEVSGSSSASRKEKEGSRNKGQD